MTYFETINCEVLGKTFKALSCDKEFTNSKERIVKLAAQTIDISNNLTYLNSGFCTRSPEYIIEKKDVLKALLENRVERIRKAFFWLNKVCKNTVGAPFLIVKIGENDVEQIANICSDFIDYINKVYRTRKY